MYLEKIEFYLTSVLVDLSNEKFEMRKQILLVGTI